jgi:hypothetical protein
MQDATVDISAKIMGDGGKYKNTIVKRVAMVTIRDSLFIGHLAEFSQPLRKRKWTRWLPYRHCVIGTLIEHTGGSTILFLWEYDAAIM